MNFVGTWPLRVLWILLPVTLGPLVDAAIADRSRPVGLTLAILVWAVWAVGIVAVLVPRTLSLTYLRVAGPAALALSVWAATVGDVDVWIAAVGLIAGAAVAVVALAAVTADAFVDGSSYGPERRFALRSPGALLLGPIQLAWLVVVVGTATGPLLLAAERWVAGGVACAVGIPAAAVCARALHQLARRWLVFVPAGLVVHDPAAVSSQLHRRQTIRSIGPAPADSDGVDLTAGAPGLAVEIALAQPTTVELVGRRGAAPRTVEVERLLVTPSRPGAVLAHARDRRLAVR